MSFMTDAESHRVRRRAIRDRVIAHACFTLAGGLYVFWWTQSTLPWYLKLFAGAGVVVVALFPWEGFSPRDAG